MSGPVTALSDRVLWGMLAEAPDLALTLGIDSVAGAALPETNLPDFSEGGIERRAQLVRDWASALKSLPEARDAAEERLTREVLTFVLERSFYGDFLSLAGERCAEELDPLTHLKGVHAAAMSMFAREARFDRPEDGERWVERLARLPSAVDGAVDALASRRRRGLLAPRPILERALADIRAALVDDPATHPFRHRLAEGLADRGDVRAARLLAQTDRLLAGPVCAAYQKLEQEVAWHQETASPQISVLRRPGGEAFYRWRFAGHTTTDLDPMQAHAIALEEFERIDAALRREFETLGVIGPRKEALRAIAARDGLPDSKTGREVLLAETRRRVEEARDRLRPLFNLWPSTDVEVRPYGPEDEASQHTSYSPPPRPGAPGVFWLNLAQALGTSRSETAVTAWHETWPGHHLQIALALELPLPAFRRAMLFAAYLEGWAKYAETLAEETLASSPLERVARLRMELYSTTTLAMDTGVHALGWSADKAADFFERETGASPTLAQMVVLRSAADPGHLCSYKIGLMKMRDLKRRFATACGARYRIQDFHDAVLSQGALPLQVLERSIETYSAQT